jgi:hypothetical protein
MYEIKITIITIVVILAVYIAIRLWTYGIFRSFFDAKKQHNTKEEN